MRWTWAASTFVPVAKAVPGSVMTSGSAVAVLVRGAAVAYVCLLYTSRCV